MKLIITESKRKEAVTKWLDSSYNNLTPKKYTIFTIYYDKSGDSVFFYYDVSGDITIEDEDLQYYLFDMFGLSRYDLNQIVKPWIEETYGINVNMVIYTTFHCDRCGKYHPTKHHIEE
jgi:hypothetical protein